MSPSSDESTSLRSQPTNKVLASLPEQEYARLTPHLHRVDLELGQILLLPGQSVDRVYFVERGIISHVLTSSEGTDVEVGLNGYEGVAGLMSGLTDTKSPSQLIVQTHGEALTLPSDLLREEFQRGGVFQQLLLRSIHEITIQTSQTALCNRLHSIEERLARWLLMTYDRVKDEQLELTQEFLANMLGSRRAGVTLAAGALRRAGLVEYNRGRLTIVDRDGLKEVACECYDILHHQFQRALE